MGEDISWLVWRINSYIWIKLAQPKSKEPHPRPSKKVEAQPKSLRKQEPSFLVIARPAKFAYGGL